MQLAAIFLLLPSEVRRQSVKIQQLFFPELLPKVMNHQVSTLPARHLPVTDDLLRDEENDRSGLLSRHSRR